MKRRLTIFLASVGLLTGLFGISTSAANASEQAKVIPESKISAQISEPCGLVHYLFEDDRYYNCSDFAMLIRINWNDESHIPSEMCIKGHGDSHLGPYYSVKEAYPLRAC